MTVHSNLKVNYSLKLVLVTEQELAVPSISQGRSVVLAAETGSGKTVTYLAPVISQLLQQQQGRTTPAAVDR